MINRILRIFVQFNEYLFISIILFSIIYGVCIYRYEDINKSKILFPILYDLDNIQIVKLSTLIFKYSFLLYNIFSKYEFNFRVVVIFILLDTLFNLVNYNILGVIKDYINTLIMCLILLFLGTLNEYIRNISYNNKLLIVYILVSIFLALYAICIFIIKILNLKKARGNVD